MSNLLAFMMMNDSQKRPSGAPLDIISKLYDVPVGFVYPHHLRQCTALYAVAVGWQLFDIG